MMTPIEKAQVAAAKLREIANKRVIHTRATWPNQSFEVRDAQADAIADLAELVLGLVAASETEKDL